MSEFASETTRAQRDSIADWTSTQLARFIRDQLEQPGSQALELLRANTITAIEQLVIGDRITVSRKASFTGVNAVGGAAPAYNTNWSNSAYGGAAGFWLDPLGQVHLRGVAQKSVAVSAGDTIFNLPPGYQPPADRYFMQPTYNGATYATAVILVEAANGAVRVASGSASQQFIGFDGIYFRIT